MQISGSHTIYTQHLNHTEKPKEIYRFLISLTQVSGIFNTNLWEPQTFF